MTSPSDDDLIDTALFQEPEGYFQPEKPATYTSHTLLSGQTLRLRLVGHNPLWVRASSPRPKKKNLAPPEVSADTRTVQRDMSSGTRRKCFPTTCTTTPPTWSSAKPCWSWARARACRAWCAGS